MAYGKIAFPFNRLFCQTFGCTDSGAPFFMYAMEDLMPDQIKIALAQVSGSPIPDENKETARHLAAEASQVGAAILILPEMFMALPRKDSPPHTVAEPLDGPFVTSLKTYAKDHNLYIIAGIWEKIAEEKRVNNTALMLSPEGNTVAVYRKLHLFDALNIRESETMVPGNALPPISPVSDFHIGLTLCYDLRFPELFRYLALQGADLVIVPSAWYAGSVKEDHWLTLLRARAIENTCYVAGANLTGSAFCGRSAVFDPFGLPIADAGERSGLLTAQIHATRIVEVRKKLPLLKHVRSDIFGYPLKIPFHHHTTSR
jgi:predicted amidohydrolase